MTSRDTEKTRTGRSRFRIEASATDPPALPQAGSRNSTPQRLDHLVRRLFIYIRLRGFVVNLSLPAEPEEALVQRLHAFLGGRLDRLVDGLDLAAADVVAHG